VHCACRSMATACTLQVAPPAQALSASVHVQTCEGCEANGVPGSEVCAGIAYVFMKWLRARYMDHYGNNPAVYAAACLDLAKEMNLPPTKRHAVTIPCTWSMDWDTRHAWVWQRLSWPRVPDTELDTLQAEIAQDILGKELPALQSTVPGDGVTADQAKAAKEERQQVLDALTKHYEQTGVNEFDLRCLNKAISGKTDYLTIPGTARMPLAAVTPECHCPAEHPVRTVKCEVRKEILELDPTSSDVKKGKIYQSMIVRAIDKRLTGAKGRKHISRSIEKLHCILQILKTPADQTVTVHYQFGKRGSKAHVVQGTGGGWIKQRKWT